MLAWAWQAGGQDSTLKLEITHLGGWRAITLNGCQFIISTTGKLLESFAGRRISAATKLLLKHEWQSDWLAILTDDDVVDQVDGRMES